MLLSPLIVIAEEAKPPAWALAALTVLSWLAPTLPVIGGSNSDSAAQYCDEEVRAACEADEKAYKGRMRLCTATAVLALSSRLESSLGDVRIPFLALHGSADRIVNVASSRRLLAEAASADKRLVEFEGARHTLLAEPPALRAEILDLIAGWLSKRAAEAGS